MKFRKSAQSSTITTNLAGGIAFSQSHEMEFISLLLTSFVEDQYYRKTSDQLARLQLLISLIPDKKFIAQALIYARNEFGMRSITHAGTIELLRYAKCQPWAKNAIAKIIKRPDDILEMIAYWIDHAPNHENPKIGLPACLRKGINIALDKFDGYQLAKYKGSKSDVKMVDVFNLVHPKPKTPERAELYKQLMKGELKSTQTWEAKLSQAGQAETEEEIDSLKGQAWKELIESKRLGYFALLRNIRNIIQQAPDCVPLACEMLKDEKFIKKSLVLPFRFLTALEVIKGLAAENQSLIVHCNSVASALGTAMAISCNNVPQFNGMTLIALDVSGSMQGKLLEIGALFAAVFVKANPHNTVMLVFSDGSRLIMLNPSDSLGTIVSIIKSNNMSGGTNFHAIFASARIPYSRIIILSDMQGWIGEALSKTFNAYKAQQGCNPYVYSIDLQGQGTMQLPERNVFCVAGFSDKIFDTIKMLEQDKNALINKIKSIEI